MDKIEEKYLPIGSVVLLKNSEKKLMITGFCCVGRENSNKIYDYSGCMYPEGILKSDKVAMFDHSQIEKVIYMGLIDEEEKKFKEKLNKLIQDYNSGILGKNAINNSSQNDIFNSSSN